MGADLKDWKTLACILTVVGVSQFIIFTIVAMLLYPEGYSFLENNFSDLGSTVVIKPGDIQTDIENPICRWIFTITVVFTAFSLIPFLLTLRTLFRETLGQHVLSYIGSISGLTAMPFLAGIGIFPTDTQSEWHELSALTFFKLFALVIIIYSLAILLNKNYRNLFSLVGFIIATHAMLHVFHFSLYDGIRPATQKVAVYLFISWCMIQVFEVWNRVKAQRHG